MKSNGGSSLRQSKMLSQLKKRKSRAAWKQIRKKKNFFLFTFDNETINLMSLLFSFQSRSTQKVSITGKNFAGKDFFFPASFSQLSSFFSHKSASKKNIMEYKRTRSTSALNESFLPLFYFDLHLSKQKKGGNKKTRK